MADQPDNTEAEEWRDIPGWEGLYRVSSLGRVESLARTYVRPSDGAVRQFLRHIHGPKKPDGTGYILKTLRGDGRVVVAHLHTFICRAFHGEPQPGQEVAHANGNRTDNRASNLRWATKGENHADKKLHGTWQGGAQNPFAKLNEQAVVAIRAEPDTPLPVLARRFKVDVSAIWKVRHRRSWKHI